MSSKLLVLWMVLLTTHSAAAVGNASSPDHYVAEEAQGQSKAYLESLYSFRQEQSEMPIECKTGKSVLLVSIVV